MTDADLTYPGGLAALVPLWEKRRGRLTFAAGEALPPPDCDLAHLATQTVLGGRASLPLPASGHAIKHDALQREFAGASELALLNALLIAHLRKRRQPRGTAALFQRIWAEQGAVLRAELPPRWLISSVITFADHGVNERQRRIGQSMNLLFSLMKLYEFERLASGHAPDQPFAARRPSNAALPLGMPPFALATGGLDVNLLAPLWRDAQGDAVAGPLARDLLERLNADPGTLFRRIAAMRGALAARRALRRKAAEPAMGPEP